MFDFKLPMAMVVILVLLSWVSFLTSIPWTKLFAG